MLPAKTTPALSGALPEMGRSEMARCQQRRSQPRSSATGRTTSTRTPCASSGEPRAALPEAPDGWVNAGYALIEIRRDDDPPERDTHYVAIDPEEISHLIRVLKRVKRQAYPHRAPCIDGNVCGGPHCPPSDSPASPGA